MYKFITVFWPTFNSNSELFVISPSCSVRKLKILVEPY